MPIVPVGMFKTLLATGVRDVFILSQFWDDPGYRDFYTSHTWDRVIIDNALYEQEDAVDFNDMIKIARDIRAREIYIVGPEVLSSGIETAYRTIDILESAPVLPDRCQMMCILHERPNEMLTQYRMLERYGLAWGISIFSYRLGYDRASLYRFVNPTGYVHAFGWDNLLEVLNMKPLGFQSIDSSIAVTAAINNIDLKQYWQITRDPGRDGVLCSNRADIRDRMFSQEQRHMVIENIQFLRSWCKRTPVIPTSTASAVPFTINNVVINPVE